MTSKFMLGHNLADEILKIHGIDPMMVKRVVIDLSVDSIATMYVEHFVSSKMLEIVKSFNGIEIQIVDKPFAVSDVTTVADDTVQKAILK